MISLLELFGGIGSSRKAIENLGYKVNVRDYVELNKNSVNAYNLLFNEKFTTQNIKEWNKIKTSTDILEHGSPCTDFSSQGKMDITLGRSILFMEVLRIIEKVLLTKPLVCLWENVKGLLYKNNIEYFNYYLAAMEKLGYKNHYKILDAREFGIPQSRVRIFVVSILKNQTKFNNDFNFEKLKTSEMKPLKHFIETNVPLNYYVQERHLKKAIERGYLNVSDNIVKEEFKQINNKVKIPITTFESENKVFNINGNIGTLTTNVKTNRILIPCEKSIKGVPIFKIDGKYYMIRNLTEREYWRLMGWEDKDIDKVIHLPKSHLYEMAGNAIVIPVLEAIFKELFKGDQENEND